jgi:hypothetical protein
MLVGAPRMAGQFRSGEAGATAVREIDMEATAPYESDIISARPVRHLLGLTLGVYGFQHQGSFSPNCSCSFSGEKGMRPLIGIDYGIHYPKRNLAVHVGLQYQDYAADFSYAEQRLTPIVGNEPDTLIDYRKYSHVRIRLWRLSPSLEWYPTRSGLFLLGGIDLGYTIAARYDNLERIESPGFAYPPPGGGQGATLMAEQTIPGGKRLYAGLLLGAGFDLRLSDHFILTPRVSASLPLNVVSADDPSWTILTEQAALIMYYRF